MGYYEQAEDDNNYHILFSVTVMMALNIFLAYLYFLYHTTLFSEERSYSIISWTVFRVFRRIRIMAWRCLLTSSRQEVLSRTVRSHLRIRPRLL